MKVHRRLVLSAQAAHQNIALRVGQRLFFGDLAALDQRLHIGVVHGPADETIAVELVHAGVSRVRPVALAAGVDEKRRQRAVRLFLCRNRRELDDEVRLLHDLPQGGYRVIGRRVIALKQLFGRQHDLVRGLAPTASSAHAVGYHGEQATVDTRMLQQRDLVLLVFAVTLVDAGRGAEAIAGGHGVQWGSSFSAVRARCTLLSGEADRPESIQRSRRPAPSCRTHTPFTMPLSISVRASGHCADG